MKSLPQWERLRMLCTSELSEGWASLLYWHWCRANFLHSSPQSCRDTVMHWFSSCPITILVCLQSNLCSHFCMWFFVLGSIDHLYFWGFLRCLTESFPEFCSSSFLSIIQNQARFIKLWLITNRCGDTAAQKINDVNLNDKVIFIAECQRHAHNVTDSKRRLVFLKPQTVQLHVGWYLILCNGNIVQNLQIIFKCIHHEKVENLALFSKIINPS